MEEAELRTRFWTLVLLLNLGPVLAVVGLFVLAFEGERWGLGVLAVGGLVSLSGARLYLRTRRRLDEEGLS
ncbi:MAG: DUF7322 domain-containing protein [Halobacteriota archaeon]